MLNFDPDLRDLVQVYWHIDQLPNPKQQEQRHLPKCSVNLVFSADTSWLEVLDVLQPPLRARLDDMSLGPMRVLSVGAIQVGVRGRPVPLRHTAVRLGGGALD